MGDTGLVSVMAASFVGSHFALSHPLRRVLIGAAGERGFLGLYSAVAFTTGGGLVWAFLQAPATAPLWAVGDGLWAV